MLELNLIRENPEVVRKSLSDRQMDTSPVEQVLSLDSERRSLLTQVEKLKAERTRLQAEATKSAKQLLGAELEAKQRELQEAQEVLKDRNKKLEEAQKVQVEMERKKRELDDKTRELDLTIEKRVTESLTLARDQAKKEVEENMKLTLYERDKKKIGRAHV